MSKKVIVIGGNAAGLSAASQIKRSNPGWEVIVLESQDEVSYASCGIPYYIQGVVNTYNDLFALPIKHLKEKRGLDVRTNQAVTRVHSEEQLVDIVTDQNNYQETYDYLIIATGAIPNTKHVTLHKTDKVFTIRQVQDGEAIKEFMDAHAPKSAGVIGGGYIGLEMVETFQNLGLETTLLHLEHRLHRAFAPEVSEEILHHMKKRGVQLSLETQVTEIFEQDDQVVVLTAGGQQFKFDMVLLAIGVLPNTEFLTGSGIELGVAGSVRVNPHLQTNIPNIYAAGDVTETRDMVTGKPAFLPLGLKANKEGTIAGTNIAAEKNVAEFPGVLKTAIVKVFDLGVARTGLSTEEALAEGYPAETVSVTGNTVPGYYPGSEKLNILVTVDTKTGRILGAQLFGPVEAVKRIDVYAALIYGKHTIDDAYHLDLAYAPPFSPVYDPVVLSGRVGRKVLRSNNNSKT